MLLLVLDPDTVFGDDLDEFQYFHYIPFDVQEESVDDAPDMKGKFKALNEKLDTLLESSITSSNTKYSIKFVKALIETLTKEHANSLQASTKAIENSSRQCKKRPRMSKNYWPRRLSLWQIFKVCLRTTLLLRIK